MILIFVFGLFNGLPAYGNTTLSDLSDKLQTSISNKTMYVNHDSDVYMRSATSVDASCPVVLKPGTQVEILEILDGWYKIKYNGVSGYIRDCYAGTSNPVSDTTTKISINTSTPTSTPTSTSTSTPTPATVTTTDAKGGKALLGWLQQAGLKGENLKMAWSIAMGESGGNPKAFNGNSRTGDCSYGLFQINMIGKMGPARRKQFGLSSNDELFNPVTNIKAMMKVSSNCTNWKPWSVYKHGTYKKFYNQYPPK